MKDTLVILLLALPFISTSQTWFQDGDQWVNIVYTGIFSFNRGIEKVTIERDTLISGKISKTVSRKYSFEILGLDTLWKTLDSYYVRQEGDSIYFEGELIYDLSMEVGDSIRWDAKGCFNTFFRVDSLFTVVLDGVQIRVQEGVVDAEYNFYRRHLRIYEGIGVAEVKGNSDEEWYKAGFLVPNIGLSCYADAIPPSFCRFVGKDFGLGIESSCLIWSSSSLWFKPTDEWVYNIYPNIGIGSYAREVVAETNTDSLVGDVTYQKLKNTIVLKNGGGDLVRNEDEPYLLRSEDRKVFYWDGKEERLVYDFNIEVGDSVKWYPENLDPDQGASCLSYFILDSIYIDTIFSTSVQVQKGRVENVDLQDEVDIQIYEGIGIVRISIDKGQTWNPGGFLIPVVNFECFFYDVGEGSFCSYSNSIFSFSDKEDCYDLSTSVNDEMSKEEIEVYPNPSSVVLNLNSDEHFSSFEIFNIEGRRLEKGILNSSQINISHLDNGVYVLSLSGKATKKELVKFVKI